MTRFLHLVAWATLCAATLAFAGDDAAKPARQYIGAGKCKTCHNSAKRGAQHKAWLMTAHAKAYANLAGPKALEIAAKKNIAEPQKSPECLQCHVTGFGEPADHFAATFVDTLGVQCESCHGAGSDYMKRSTMIALHTGKEPPAKHGLVVPTKETCAACHNEKSPSGKFVDWPADSAKVAHPIPPGAASTSEDAAD